MSTDAAAVIAGDGRICGDIVVMATGVSARCELGAQAGLALDDGAIPTSAAIRTECDSLLAAGDVCKAQNLAAGRSLRVEHWGDALEQGQIAGRTAAGARARWSSVPGFWSTIGRRALKYAAWGDGFDQARLQPRGEHGFAVWYCQRDALVGVLTHDSDEDYEQGMKRIAEGAAWGS